MIRMIQLKKQIELFKELSKSGIVTLVLISVFAGYLIGQPHETSLDGFRLTFTLIGILFLSSGSSALNQLQEKDIDAQMPRTAGRPLPSNRMTVRSVQIFVGLHLLIGFAILLYLSPTLLGLGVLAVVSYNGLYTLWWKRRWAYAAVPGAIPGALPILMGHFSAQGQIWNPGGLYLFFILFFWQMPHFWTLALRYQKDYQQGGFPTLPVIHGLNTTLVQIAIWCLCYMGLANMAPFFLKVGWIYGVSTLLVEIKLAYELYGFLKNPESKNWLRFFLWINLSLILFLGAAAVDLWSIHLPIPYLNR